MKRLCDFYIRRTGTIGFLYSAAPTLAWFGAMLTIVEFRHVYLARLAIALVVGGGLAACVNRFGVGLWLAKHRSAAGPATVLDGALIGAGTGYGTVLVAPLTSFISSNHLPEAKTLVIGTWLAGTVVGLVLGAVLAAVGRRHVGRGVDATERPHDAE